MHSVDTCWGSVIYLIIGTTETDGEKYTNKIYMKSVVSFRNPDLREDELSNLNTSVIQILFSLQWVFHSYRCDFLYTQTGYGKLFDEKKKGWTSHGKTKGLVGASAAFQAAGYRFNILINFKKSHANC